MRSIGKIALLLVVLLAISGCGNSTPDYGAERPLNLPGSTRQTWAVAPAVDLSGQKSVDSILQADLLYGQLQQVAGLNVVPVNRVVAVFEALKITQIQSEEQAALICDLLGCDGLIMASVTYFDPYEPPKMGVSLQLFKKSPSYRRPLDVDPRELARRATPSATTMATARPGFIQVVGMFDSANGSTRAEALRYAQGRNDPAGPLKERGYLVEMDRYCGFVYFSLIEELLRKPAINSGQWTVGSGQ